MQSDVISHSKPFYLFSYKAAKARGIEEKQTSEMN